MIETVQDAKRILDYRSIDSLVWGISLYCVYPLRYIMFRDPYYSLAWKLLRTIGDFDTDSYCAPLNPLKIVWVDPDCIQYRGLRYRGDISPKFKWGNVKSGDWDRLTPSDVGTTEPSSRITRKFEEHHVYKSFRKHFIDGDDWSETETYQIGLREIQDGGSYWHGCKTVEDLNRRCRYYDELFESIQSDGYKLQRELRYRGFLPTLRDEIVVDIGRHGELLHIHSKHRLAIAKILGLDEIPVAISTRHNEWMEFRDEVYSGNTDVTHPDMGEFRRGATAHSGPPDSSSSGCGFRKVD